MGNLKQGLGQPVSPEKAPYLWNSLGEYVGNASSHISFDAGTVDERPPEYNVNCYDPKAADIWQMGVSFLKLVDPTAWVESKLQDCNQTKIASLQQGIEKTVATITVGHPVGLSRMINGMLQMNPHMRLTSEEVLIEAEGLL